MPKAKVYFGCAVEGCEKTDRPGRKYCGMHDARLRIYGDVNYSYKNAEEVSARFWKQVDKNGPIHPRLGTRCWLWTGQVDKDGYGLNGASRKYERRAHRFAYAEKHGAIPDGLLIRHQCDVRQCVNDSHLETGTTQQNTADMVERGRVLRGEQKPQARLDADTVRSIRDRARNGEKKAPMARELNVSEATVSHAILNRTWRHVQ